MAISKATTKQFRQEMDERAETALLRLAAEPFNISSKRTGFGAEEVVRKAQVLFFPNTSKFDQAAVDHTVGKWIRAALVRLVRVGQITKTAPKSGRPGYAPLPRTLETWIESATKWQKG